MNDAAPNLAKKYALTFEHRPCYLYAHVAGEKNSYEISIGFWREIADCLAETDYDKVLVDENIAEAPSVSEVFQIVSELPGMGFVGVRIAYYDRTIEHQEVNDFGELVGKNRGLIGRAFNDYNEAESWLLAEM